MRDTIKFVLFIIYTAMIFLIRDYSVLIIIGMINIVIMFLEKVNLWEVVKSSVRLLPFILAVMIINAIWVSANLALLIGVRLLLVCNITYIFTKRFTSNKLSTSIENILTPLKVFGVNTKDVGIMISVAVAFIPILRDEVDKLKCSLISKGFRLNGINMVKNINLILVPLIVSVLKRVEEMENALKSKGYVSE